MNAQHPESNGISTSYEPELALRGTPLGAIITLRDVLHVCVARVPPGLREGHIRRARYWRFSICSGRYRPSHLHEWHVITTQAPASPRKVNPDSSAFESYTKARNSPHRMQGTPATIDPALAPWVFDRP